MNQSETTIQRSKISTTTTPVTCPQTGLARFSKPEWDNIVCSDTLRLKVWLLGDNIVAAKATGSAENDAVIFFFRRLRQILAECFRTPIPWTLIFDWTELTAATLEARQCYIHQIKTFDTLKASVFCGVSPFFKTSIRLAGHLNTFGFVIKIVDTYKDAVAWALAPSEDSEADEFDRARLEQRMHGAHVIYAHPAWHFDKDGLKMCAEVIDGRILHTATQGTLKPRHIPMITALCETVCVDLGLADGFDYILAEVRQLNEFSRQARWLYLREVSSWHRRYPFRCYILYGANRLVAGASSLARPLMPFNLKVVADLDAALALIDVEDGRGRRPVKAASQPETPGHIAELVEYLSEMDWEQEGTGKLRAIDPRHPYRQVFEALALVKHEFDQLTARHRRKKKALSQNEQRYRVLLGALPNPVVVYDPQGNAIYTNEAFKATYGWRKNELVSRRDDFVPPHARDATQTAVEKIRQGLCSNFETERRTKKGRTLTVQIRTAVIKNDKGRVTDTIVIHEDVTQRRLTEDRLNRQNELLEVLHKTALDLIGRLDPDDLLSALVSRTASFFRTPHSFLFLHNPALDKLELKVGTGLYENHIGFLMGRGEGLAGKVWVSGQPLIVNDYASWLGRHTSPAWDSIGNIAGMPIKTGDEVTGVIGFSIQSKTEIESDDVILLLGRLAEFTSITLENARLYTAAQREIERRRRAQLELRRAMEAAEAGTLAKSAFLANMSHEIRTPMNAVLSLADLLMQTELSTRQFEYLDLIRSSGQTLLSIINEILDFSKIEAGKIELESTEFELEGLLNEVVDLFATDARSKQIDLVMLVKPDVPARYIGDPLRIKQILVNLIANALKFTTTGSIRGRVELSEKTDDKVALQVSIADTGVGIPAEKIDTLFEPFCQADDSTTRRFGGTGLGLSICKYLVEAMQGKIEVESDVGQGSCFTFNIRLGRIYSQNQYQTDLPAAIQAHRIAVVTANDVVGDFLTEFLTDLRLKVNRTSALAELTGPSTGRGAAPAWGLVILDAACFSSDFVSKYWTAPPPILLLSKDLDAVQTLTDQLTTPFKVLSMPVKQSDLVRGMMALLIDPTAATPAVAKQVPGIPKAKPFAGFRLLLVEDNAINRQVATWILEKSALEVVAAVDGLEAVAAVRSENFDLILMDIQMPNMDGLEATRVIREEKRQLPIIGLTADAMGDAREKCLAAGMNDMVTKPIEAERLFGTLTKWLTSSQDDLAAATNAEPGEKQAPVELTSLEGIDHTLVLKRFDGKIEFYYKLLRDFGEDFSRSGRELQSALANDDLKQARFIVHTIKGVAGNLAATRLHRASLDLENTLKQERDAAFAAPVAGFLTALDQFNTQCTRIIQAATTTAAVATSAKTKEGEVSNRTVAKLADLINLVRSGDMTAVSVLQEVAGELVDLGLSAHSNALAFHLNKYEFKQAGHVLAQLNRLIQEKRLKGGK